MRARDAAHPQLGFVTPGLIPGTLLFGLGLGQLGLGHRQLGVALAGLQVGQLGLCRPQLLLGLPELGCLRRCFQAEQRGTGLDPLATPDRQPHQPASLRRSHRQVFAFKIE